MERDYKSKIPVKKFQNKEKNINLFEISKDKLPIKNARDDK